MKRSPHRAAMPPARLVVPAFVAGAFAVAVAVAAAAALPSVAHAADESLGGALYESRCTGCHERSVHSRDPRRAGTFDQIRAYVYRWDRYLGGAWQRAEIDAVARYLNERYYHFPCPQDVCGMAAR